ncbi:hypothetical protein EII29_07705 [Leptotrichia sp. OH3620_COT-345]|uniref:hypothetical protein n=1 Tax=Leptotrichia sp. OH3620_COT-345 TaxID=2491048 RepID=UPI000F647C5E|nr:hypothetical protein [Leptotrichia sp. OH3620_COT-345]RRD39283.1 hypothetical protein EII29_07705 [Leptotrichia sp. OH3620_COT-345]
MNKKELERLTEEIILEMVNNGELQLNDEYEIEYTQSWLNNWLMEWINDGYTTEEAMIVLETFETFEYEKEAVVSTITGIHTYDNGNQEYITEDEIVDVLVTMKKVA